MNLASINKSVYTKVCDSDMKLFMIKGIYAKSQARREAGTENPWQSFDNEPKFF
ncbi:MAG: hypothetical protein ACLP7A_08935 [Desulfobaccales bacterium]